MHKFYKKKFLLALFTLITALVFSQDISGTWVGNYGRNLLTSHPEKLVVEIEIHNDSLISGLSHLYYKNNKYEHYKIKGVFRKRDSTFYFREDSTISVKLGPFSGNCLGNYKTKLRFTDSSMRQEGKWRDREFLGCPATTVWLEKKLDHPKQEPVIAKPGNPETVKPVVPNKILLRQTDVQNLVEVAMADKDSIKIEVYDNGIVDDDSVSLYVDEKEIVTNRRISTSPIVFYISLNKDNPLSKLRLVAESLGSIPPCTAIMIITTRHKRQELSLSSNFNKNGAVEFFLKE